MKTILAILLLLVISASAMAQGITTTMTADKTTLKVGESVTVTNLVSNNNAVIVAKFEAWASYTFGTETISSDVATLNLTIVHPAEITQFKANVPNGLEYVLGSARLDGQAITQLSVSPLIFPVAKTLEDGQKTTIIFQLKAVELNQ